MKRFFLLFLVLALVGSLGSPAVFAGGTDWIIDSPSAPFPVDTVIDGDLILTGDCPAVVNLINTRITGALRIETGHPVTVHLQGNSSCDSGIIQAKSRIYGGSFREIVVETTYFSLQDSAAATVLLQADDSLLTTNSPIGSLTVEGQNAFLGGSGRVELLTLNAPGCRNLLHSSHQNGTQQPKSSVPAAGLQVDFQVTPVVSPADSVVRAQAVFESVPAEKQGDYRIYWYIGQTLVDYDWHFQLEEGAVASMARSIHFDGVMNSETVWLRLVSNEENNDTELKFAKNIRCTGYSTAKYDETKGFPYEIHLIRNQNTVIVYGLDDAGKYTEIVNVFPCSTGFWKETEVGEFEINLQMRWGSLMGDLYGQFCSQFNGNQLFHSVPYYSQDPSDLEFAEYNYLGEAASSGCVRLATADARWIYYHCNSGTKVHSYDSDTLPVVKPIPALIREDSLNRGWDPTDITPGNPTRTELPPDPFPRRHPGPLHEEPYLAFN